MTDRQQKLRSTTVYALFHNDELLYVGCTLLPLERRKAFHVNASTRFGSKFYSRIEGLTKGDLTITEIPYETENKAIKALDPPCNTNQGRTAPLPYDGYDWSEEELDRLGEVPDEQLADELGISWDKIRNARVKLGIEAQNAHSKHVSVDWDEWDDRLGTMSDPQLAEEIGCAASNVARRRQQLGVEAFSDPHALSKQEAREVLFRYNVVGGVTQAELAEEYDVSRDVIGELTRGETYEHVERPATELTGVQAAQARVHATKGKTVEWIAQELYATTQAVHNELAPITEKTNTQKARAGIDG